MTTLPNGLRGITDTNKEGDSVALGVWVDVGTRHEDMADNGVAHMVEHMMFKGTPTRTTTQIVEQLEDVGGNVNAYTGREITAYHVHLLKEDMPLALDIMSDIMQHTNMPPEEIERERGVIIQEIGMSNDAPDDLVFDYYQEVAYPGQTHNLRMTSNESLDSVNLSRDQHEFSYKDGDGYHFMHPDTFEDVLLGPDMVKKEKDYLIEGQKYMILLADDVVAGIELPASVTMTVAESPEGVKGDSANNVYKEAIMEPGLRVQVPLFIGPGDKISVKTEDGTYLGRSN